MLCCTNFVNHRISESVGLVGTTVCHLFQPCSSWVILEHIAQGCIQTVLEYPASGLSLTWVALKELSRSPPPEIPSTFHR